MESATKALLIAATVLIAILIIALGVVLIKNASNTTKQADEVGNSLGKTANSNIQSILLYNIESCYGKYTDKNKIVNAYKTITENVKKYNELNEKQEISIDIDAIADYRTKDSITSSSFFDNLTTKDVELLAEWFLDEGNEIWIKESKTTYGKRIYFFFGEIKNHTWDEIFNYME